MINQALELHQSNHIKEAISLYKMILNENPSDFNALHLYGLALAQSNELLDGLSNIDAALKLNPTHSFTLNIRGFILKELGRLEEALDALNLSISYNDSFAETHFNKGVVLQQIGKHTDAASSLLRAIELEPHYCEVYPNLAKCYLCLREYERALHFCEIAITLCPSDEDAYYNQGVIQLEYRKFIAAINSFGQALLINPLFSKALHNIGLAWFESGQINLALSFYDKALSQIPESVEIIWNKSIAMLISGNFREGFPLYESRLHHPKLKNKTPKSTAPPWDGISTLDHKTVLVYTEQGLGDTVQFCRYLLKLVKLNAKIIFQVKVELFELMRSVHPNIQVISRDTEVPAHDFYVSLLSLPGFFYKIDGNLFASPQYLLAPQEKINYWHFKLGPLRKPRIGVVWSSFSDFSGDDKRSLNLKEFMSAFPSGEFDIICLQQEIKEIDKAAFEQLTPEAMHYFGPELRDLSDTAALISCLDLVVSTCTCVTHLSAALGKETWTLLSYVPDWRWQMSDKTTPWYPSMRLVRQKRLDDWVSALETLYAELSSYIKNIYVKN